MNFLGSLIANSQTYIMLGVVGVMVVLLFVWPMITNRKKGKQINDMRTTIRIGDEIMTIGGIVGKIVEIHEKNGGEKDFVIQTGVGDAKATMTFDMRALHENRTRMKELQEEAAKQAEIQRIEREAKKAGKNNDVSPRFESRTEVEPAAKEVEVEVEADEPKKD